MTDPAIEAAQRTQLLAGIPPRVAAKLGAREALTPIRAWYGRVESTFEGQRDDTAQMVMLLLGELAPLIYTTEELS